MTERQTRRPMSLPDFLAREKRQEPRLEFDGFQPVAMTGGTCTQLFIGDTLPIPEIGVDRAPADLYADADLPEPPTEEASA